MVFEDVLDSPGEHGLLLPGPVGQIEVRVTVPERPNFDYIALIGHPHSLQGGTMNNKVVTTMLRAFKALSIPSIRFNFRGVGQSSGVYDDGVGESADMLRLAGLWEEVIPGANFMFAGFSFGSYVAYRAAAQRTHSLLLTIAPPVHHYDYKAFSTIPEPWVIVQGDMDEVVPLDLVLDFSEGFEPPLSVLRFPDTGHFFHGKLVELKSRLMEVIETQGLRS